MTSLGNALGDKYDMFSFYINNDNGNCLNKYLNKKMNLEGDNLNYNWYLQKSSTNVEETININFVS